jgi:hypothetical protein
MISGWSPALHSESHIKVFNPFATFFHVHSTLRNYFCCLSCVLSLKIPFIVIYSVYLTNSNKVATYSTADKNNLFLYGIIENCPPINFFESFLASLHIPAKIKMTVHLDYCRIFFSTHGEIKFWHAGDVFLFVLQNYKSAGQNDSFLNLLI